MHRLALLALFLLASCSSIPSTLVESDVPVPPDLRVRYSLDLKRDAGTLTGGWFILWGRIDDVVTCADKTTSRFTENGWTAVSREMLPKQATLVFSKDVRTCRVVIDARRVDPRSSSATELITSSSAQSSAPSSG